MVRAHITVRGAVQGVGFRPFIYRLATSLGLTGSVVNTPRGVIIVAEGSRETIDLFLTRIETERPPRAFIQSLDSAFLDPAVYTSFEIRASLTTGETTAIVMPDSP